MFRPAWFGKYYLYERLAVGGMAEIYKAKIYGVDGFEKNMVVKQILPQYARHQEFIQMFVDEAKISVSLTHGNVVPVYELGSIEGTYFISMDYVDGKNLGELLDAGLDEDKPLAVPHSLFIATEILAGLDYAHRKSDEKGRPQHIVHRDVSPQNILVSYEGEAKIVDFGIARAASKVHATEAGVIKGKFGYMSPEQAMGKDVDARSDVFAAGILLYEMVTLERLFAGGTEVATIERVKRADVPTPSRANPKLPPQLDAIVFKALAREPANRYQTAGEMRLAVSRFLYQLPEEASSKTLSNYMKDLFGEEIRERQNRPDIPPPPSVKQAPPTGMTPPPPPAGAERYMPPPPVVAGPEALFDPGAAAPAAGPQAAAGVPPLVSDELIEDDFTYLKAGKRLGRMVWIGILIVLIGLGVIFYKDIVNFFSTVGEVIDESAERLAQKDLGTLMVRSRPSGAAVYFDNRKVGKTNVRIGTIDPALEYELVLTLEGYPPWSRKILPSDWKQDDKMTIHVFKDFTADSFK